MMRLHEPRLLEEALIYRLYEFAIAQGRRLSFEEIGNLFPKTRLPGTLVRFALKGLESRRFLSDSGEVRNPYEITREGYEYVRRRLTMNGSAIQKFSKDEEWLSGEEQDDDDAADDGVPAADRIVTLDHNSAAYTEATSAYEALIDASKKSNELGAEDPGEKDRVIAELEAGKRILESTQVSQSKIRRLVGDTLTWIAEKFAGSMIAQLAQTAWALIKPLIGL